MTRVRTRLSCSLPIWIALVASLLASPTAAQEVISPQPMSYDAALARYQECMSRKPFQYHTIGRYELSRTRSPQALEILTEDYRKAKEYTEYARYLMAWMIGREFGNAESVPVLAALRDKCDKPGDAWLWYWSLRIETDAVGEATAVKIATESKDPVQRAAAIAAIGSSNRGDLSSVVLANSLSFPKKEADRMVILGAMTGALFEQKSRVNTEEYRKALKAYISLLGDDVKLNDLAKLQMARHLQWILNGPAMFVNPEPWLELLERGDVKQRTGERTAVPPRFFGIESEGERVCYLVDMSDSMCKEIDPDARPKGPITGPKPKKKKKGLALDEGDLPWHQIRTRWDLAREQLRISLSRLTPDKRFAIVWFGTDAGVLDATKGMVKATPGNIKKAMEELDAVQMGPIEPGKAPDGQLRGRTNLHSGLRLAFGLAGRGFVDEHAYVDKDPLAEGCDTIFLLSDGAPSWDGFATTDKDYGEARVVVDVEYAAETQRAPRLEYHGPYVWDDFLVADLQRMNAFRRIRMHCVGLGEANVALLERLAEIGHGEVFVVGRKK